MDGRFLELYLEQFSVLSSTIIYQITIIQCIHGYFFKVLHITKGYM